MSSQKKVLVLLVDGFADWEPALAISEINQQENLKVVSVGFTKEVVISMGGLKVLPDMMLSEVRLDDAAILIIPGSALWEKQENLPELDRLLHELHNNKVPIAAICGATLVLARTGILNETRHTSNTLNYIKTHIQEYKQEAFYIETQAVRDKGIITSGGADYVEFTLEIIKELKIYDDQTAQIWYDLFKHGILPENMPSD